MQAIIRGFRKLFQFGGRDSPSQFWPYAGLVLIVSFALMGTGVALAMPPVFEEAARVAQENPESVRIESSPTSYSVQISPDSGFMPDFSAFFLTLGIGVAFVVTLLAAAVSRRLHDRGLTGFIGLIPLIFLTAGLFGMQRLMASFDSPDFDEGLFLLLFANNVLYLASLAGLIILLILPGQPKANRYGPAEAV